MENLLQNVDGRKSASNVNNSDSTSTSIKPASKSQIEYNHSFKGKTITLVKGTDLSERKVSTSMYDLFGIKKPSSPKAKLDMNNTLHPVRIKKEKTGNNAKCNNMADNLEAANKNNESSVRTDHHFEKESKRNEQKSSKNDDDLMFSNDQNLSEIEDEIANIDKNKDVKHKLKKTYHTVNKNLIKPAIGVIEEHPIATKSVLSIVKSAFSLLSSPGEAIMSAVDSFIDGASSLIDKKSAHKPGSTNDTKNKRTESSTKTVATFNKIIANMISVACQIGIGIASGLSKLCIIYAVWDLAADTFKNLLLKIPLISKFAEKHKIAFEVIFTAVSIIAKITTGICTGTLFAALTSSAVTLMFSLINIFTENEGALDKTLRFLKQNILHIQVHDDQESETIKDEIKDNFNKNKPEDIGKLNNTNDNILIIPV